MKRTSYGERDYTFGQRMLTLRTTLGLTQAGLAERLGVSRRAVAEWEAGSSYPKAERLKELIELGVRASAFAAVQEAEEIRAFWRAAHRKVLLEERWLQELFTSAMPVQPSPADLEHAAIPRIDLVEALDVSHFAGREVEVAELTQWIVQERCRLIALLGMGGIGKSMLASYLGLHLAKEFEVVLWRSVRDAPFLRGPGRRLHLLLLRDTASCLPQLAGAAHHAARGPLADPALPAGTRQPGDPAGEQ
jgi:transcriptional regulator with XRE-family HTH domain